MFDQKVQVIVTFQPRRNIFRLFAIFTFVFLFFTEIDPELAVKFKRINFLHKNPPVLNPVFNIDAFAKYLKKKPGAQRDIDFIKNGFPLWLITHGSDDKPALLSQEPVYAVDTIDEAHAILGKFIQELEDGALLPTNQKPEYLY